MTPIQQPIRHEPSGLEYFRREPDGVARRLIVLFHGAGANAADLEGLEARFAARVPDAVWLRPDAPHTVVDGLSDEEMDALRRARPGLDLAGRRSWAAELMGGPAAAGVPPGVDPSTMGLEAVLGAVTGPVEASLATAVSAVHRLIDAELERLGLDDAALALFGFSQGGLAALHTGLARERPCAAVVSHSGQFYGMSEVASTPPVLLLVGEKEIAGGRPGEVIFPWSARALREAGVEVEEYVAKGLGHGSSRRSDVVICRFIERAFQEGGR